MKKYLLVLSTIIVTQLAVAQINLPINPINQPVLIPGKQLMIPGLLGNAYIQDNGTNRFWAAHLRDRKLVTNECPSNADEYKWKFVGNADGSYYIVSAVRDELRVVYQKSNLVIPNVGISVPSTAGDQGFYLGTDRRSSTAITVYDKMYIRSRGENNFRSVFADRRDSMVVKLFYVNSYPLNFVSFSFNNLTGWESTGNAFTGQPSGINRIPYYTSPVVPPMPLGGSYWKDIEDYYYSFNTKTDQQYINTARPGNNRWAVPNERTTGTLVSLPYFVCADNLTFKIAGTRDESNIKFEILQRANSTDAGTISLSDGRYRIIQTYTGHNNDIARWMVYRNAAIQFSVLRLRITDNTTTGHIILDDITFGYTGQLNSELPAPDPVIPVNKPVFGTIDMHTHPMSYMGMGGVLMHGRLDGTASVALGNCNESHGGWGLDNIRGNYIRAEIVNMIDEHYDKVVRLKFEDGKVPHNDHPHDGFPALVNWPAQNSMTHQQMWYTWLRRANEGGLKAIIALTVNSELLCKALGGADPYDDKTTADRQIDELIAFVRRHPDFLDTVTSSARMRQVIAGGRMAVIIGMEIDNIGNFYKNAPVTETQIRNEITRLKNKGVRYFFPIHVVDNKFGGAAAYKELFNYSNKFAGGQPIVGMTPARFLPPVLPGRLMDVEHAPDSRISFAFDPMGAGDRFLIRSLAELVEAGGLPILPDPIVGPLLLTVKPIIDPVLIALRESEQYQLLKKYYLDIHPEAEAYRSTTPGFRNRLGLSGEGTFAVKEMMRQGLLIDVDHASERSVNDILTIASRNDYPVNSGHNGMRDRNDNEKTRTAQQMRTIDSLGGMFGLGWENQTPEIFRRNYERYSGPSVGMSKLSFGSDIGGYATTIMKPTDSRKFINYTDKSRPDFFETCTMEGSPRTWNFNTEGMVHIGLYPDFYEALKKDGMSLMMLHKFFLGAEHFIQMWEKCEARAALVER